MVSPITKFRKYPVDVSASFFAVFFGEEVEKKISK